MRKNYSAKYIFIWLSLLVVTTAGSAQQQPPSGAVKSQVAKSGALKSQVVKSGSGNNSNVGNGDSTGSTTGLTNNRNNGLKNDNDELVPLGFGLTRRKAELTSAIGTVKAGELSKSGAINPANALYGRIPGLTVLQNGGASWENDPDLFIRGIGTFQNGALLILVDGFERPLSSLSLNEIESVSILKDAAALALYGGRGANGVLLVTTKRGSAERIKVDLSYEHGSTQAFRLPRFKNAFGYAQAINQARANDGLTPFYSQADLDRYKDGSSPSLFPDVDWMDQTFRKNGSVDNLSATFKGSGKGVRYFTLLNYQTDRGLLGPVNTNPGYTTQLNYGKFNFRTNLDIELTGTTKLTVNLGGNLREAKTPGKTQTDIMNALYTLPSAAFPVKTYNGIWGGTSTYSNNPLAMVSATGYRLTQTRELLADMRLEQQLDIITKGLSAEVAVAYDNSAAYQDNKTKKYQYQALRAITDPVSGAVLDTVETLYGQNTALSYSTSLANQWRHATLQGALKYTKNWGNNSIHSALIFQEDKLVRNNQFNTFIHDLAALDLQYAGAGKYFAGLTLSYSGTNVLPKGKRFGAFPALSVGWKLSEEKWFAKTRAIDELKLRASWGLTGNDLVTQNIADPRYDAATGYYVTPNNVATPGFHEGQLASTGVTYETATKYNVGIDARFFGMLDLTADVFYDRRKNILVASGGLVSSVLGVTPPLTNAGIMDNKGLELGANFYQDKGDLHYHISGQFSFVRNKIIAMGEAYQPYDNLKRTGRSYGQAFGLEAIGFFKDQADIDASPKQLFSAVSPGDIKYKDQNNDGVINAFDEKPIGSGTRNPEIYYSASLGVEWKGIGIDALFQGIGNQTLYLNTPSVFWPLRGNTTVSDFSDNSWTPATASTATLPRLSTLENANNYRPNSIWYRNGAFLKLRTLELHYDLRRSLISKIKLSNARIYVRGTNLFSIDHIKVTDPEATGVIYPTLASVDMGIKIGF